MAMRRLLSQASSRARVYAVGIVIDGTQAKTTWHLQRELEALVDSERGRWKLASPLGSYLTGTGPAGEQGAATHAFRGPRCRRANAWPPKLSGARPSARCRARPVPARLGSILHLCAEALVRQTEALLEGGSRANMEQLLITSSNNRAVDNVLEPLGAVDGLALALRAGSRQSCEQQLLVQLRRALAWLKRAAGESALERHRAADTRKGAISGTARRDRTLAGPAAGRARARESALQLSRELELCAPEPSDATMAALSLGQRQALLLALAALEKRLQALSKLTEERPRTSRPRRSTRTTSARPSEHCRRSRRR